MTTATIRNPDPFPVALGPVGATQARCRLCALPTGPQAWADQHLTGLYCSPHCCQRAALERLHPAPRPYTPEAAA